MAGGFSANPQVVQARVWGMYLTLTSITTTAIANILLALF